MQSSLIRPILVSVSNTNTDVATVIVLRRFLLEFINIYMLFT